jgi:cytochrome c oxidase cbb3-type subunit I
MTFASISPSADLADQSPAESTGRAPLLYLLGSSILWLVVSGILSLITSIQLHTPNFLADCPITTYGRVRAMAETSFIYGWIGNVGLGLALWILGRLSGEKMRGANWVIVGALFWNLGVTLAIGGLALGNLTSIPMYQIPGYVQPIFFFAYGAIAIAGLLSWTGRRREMMFASQWYAIAALFLFPWLFSIAYIMLQYAPVRGVLQAVVGGWYGQGIWTLWIAPLALCSAYYIVPRVSGKLLPAYDTAALGFWTLLVVGGWTGARHLIGGPIPAWVSSVAIVTTITLVFHYIVVFLNLRPALKGGSLSISFIAIGVICYVAGGFVDGLTSLRPYAVITQFTVYEDAQRELALFGGASMMFFGALYFAVPRLTGSSWSSGALIKGQLFLSALGILITVLSLAAAGLLQGDALADAKVNFSTIATQMKPYLLVASVGRLIILFSSLLLALNFFKTIITHFILNKLFSSKEGAIAS